MGKNKIKTRLIHSGIDTLKNHGSLSDPIYKSSTLIFKNYREYTLAKKNKFSKPYYGRFGSFNTKRLENIMSDLFHTKEEAEQAASKFGCIGAHKMGSKWMPCKMH